MLNKINRKKSGNSPKDHAFRDEPISKVTGKLLFVLFSSISIE